MALPAGAGSVSPPGTCVLRKGCPQEGVSPWCSPPPVSPLCGCHVSSQLSLSHPGPTIPPAAFPSSRQTPSSGTGRAHLLIEDFCPKVAICSPDRRAFLSCRAALSLSRYIKPGGLGFRTVVFLTTTSPKGGFPSPLVAHSGHSRWWEQNNKIRGSSGIIIFGDRF